MALIENQIVCANVGAAWAAFLAQWEWALGQGVGTVSGIVTTRLGLRALRLVRAHPPDTTIWYYCCADIQDTSAKVPLPYVLGSPGWRRMPNWVYTGYGIYTTVTFFEDHAKAVRRSVMTDWCEATLIAGTRDDRTFAALSTLTMYQYSDRWQAGPIVMVDGYSLETTSSSPGYSLNGYAQTTDGLLAGSPATILANGLSQGQIDELSSGLQDIATVDFDYTANNGRSIFSMRGRVITGT